jgi:hypothetical protein
MSALGGSGRAARKSGFDCVKKTRERHAVGEMRGDPSDSPCLANPPNVRIEFDHPARPQSEWWSWLSIANRSPAQCMGEQHLAFLFLRANYLFSCAVASRGRRGTPAPTGSLVLRFVEPVRAVSDDGRSSGEAEFTRLKHAVANASCCETRP